jgi:hypothetical protein
MHSGGQKLHMNEDAEGIASEAATGVRFSSKCSMKISFPMQKCVLEGLGSFSALCDELTV